MFFITDGLSHSHGGFYRQQCPQFPASASGGTRCAQWHQFLPINMAHHQYMFQPSFSVPSLYSFIATANVHLCRTIMKVLFWSLRVILRLLRSILGQVGEHIDRLKLAHLDLDRSIQVALPRPREKPQGNRPHITTFPFQVP